MTLSKDPLKYLLDTDVIKILAVRAKWEPHRGRYGQLAERFAREGAPRLRRKRKKPEIR